MELFESAEQFKLKLVPELSNSGRKVFQGDQWYLRSANGEILGEFRKFKAIAYPDHHSTKIALDFDWIHHGWRVIRGGMTSYEILGIADISLGTIDPGAGYAGCGDFHHNIPLQWNSDAVFPQMEALMVKFSAATWKGC
jgi:hypothetical protein